MLEKTNKLINDTETEYNLIIDNNKEIVINGEYFVSSYNINF